MSSSNFAQQLVEYGFQPLVPLRGEPPACLCLKPLGKPKKLQRKVVYRERPVVRFAVFGQRIQKII